MGPIEFDLVIAVCGHADENCPTFNAALRFMHAPFDDLPRFAAELQGDDSKMAPYRRVRDEIRAFIECELPLAAF